MEQENNQYASSPVSDSDFNIFSGKKPQNVTKPSTAQINVHESDSDMGLDGLGLDQTAQEIQDTHNFGGDTGDGFLDNDQFNMMLE